ncbi:AAA family ATPase, partial [Candidatus Woesearchaeota archaeon]|nr:AAA family ATPase [Candidatus Woesearchaeota archaeon]
YSMIIGITGTIGSGKDTVLDYLVNMGFARFSFSTLIREYAKEKGFAMDRQSLEDAGDALRNEHGNDPIFARKIIAEIDMKGIDKSAVGGIRQPWEIEEFRKHGDFYLIAVDADQRKRFERTSRRGGATDAVNFEQFKKFDEKEYNGEGSRHQQIKKTMELADFTITNNASYDDLYQQIDDILEKIRKD